ncbi:MAG: protease HtpX [Pseudobdellovibrionaceae bacterium]
MWFKRIGLFILTNLLVIITISVTANIIFGLFGITLPTGMQGLLVMCALMGFSGSMISLMMSKFMAKHFYGVQIIDPATRDPEMHGLVEMVHALSRRAGLTVMPEVGIYEAPEINAFATGPSKKNSLVALSTGLFRSMSREEVEGVVGHEVAHIANGDMVTMTLIQGVVNTFVLFLSRILASLIANNSSDDERGSPMVQFGLTMLFDILFAILASILVNYFSRRREFRADAGGAKYAGREKMLAGLRKLQSQYEQIAPDNGSAATLKISNKSSGLMALFSTHPPLEERIRRLQSGR